MKLTKHSKRTKWQLSINDAAMAQVWCL